MCGNYGFASPIASPTNHHPTAPIAFPSIQRQIVIVHQVESTMPTYWAVKRRLIKIRRNIAFDVRGILRKVF
jgi:hypothetical protein